MSTVVRARIDEKIKDDATAVLASIGLTVSDAFRLMMMRIAAEKRLPFEPLVPNAETIEAIKAALNAPMRDRQHLLADRTSRRAGCRSTG